ncbi:MAG TPA: DUF6457 domain-containing protein [Microbacteriaceae bacterium]|nr:DUF6457 domain-containing protein [Microbacteriaceae bacterium]
MSDTTLPDGIPEWVTALRARYDLSEEQLPTNEILKLAGVAAHSVTRPAAPVTTFVAGLVAGSRGGTPAEIDALIAELSDAARTWDGPAAGADR